jgi:hypothetical protein
LRITSLGCIERAIYASRYGEVAVISAAASQKRRIVRSHITKPVREIGAKTKKGWDAGQ